MENAVEALKMAGAVLLFVIALSVAILAFTTSRESLDKMIKYSDRESLTIENDSRFYYLANDEKTKRYVGVETIIPTIYRTVHENLKIIFEFKDSSSFLYKESGNYIKKIDRNIKATSNDDDYIKFLNGIIYGFSGDNTRLNKYIKDFGIEELSTEGCLYERISRAQNIGKCWYIYTRRCRKY